MPGGAAEPGTGDAHLVEHRIDSEVRLSGGFLTVLRDRVRLPDGATATREYIRHPGAVAVVPILDDGRLVLVRQYRHPVGRVLLEWPAGKLDGGEPVLACAVRELREETGYRAREWARAGVFHNACAYSDEGIEIWFARGLVEGAASLDAGALQALVLSGEVTDMKTVLGLLWLQRWRCGGWSADWQPAP